VADVNRVTIHGNVGNAPDVKALNGGGKVASFSVATTERYKDRSGADAEKTTWHRVVAWGWLADAAANLPKGARVVVEGKLDVREWQDKDGAKRTTTEIVAWSVSEVVRPPRADSRQEAQRPTSTPAQQSRRPAPVNSDAFGDDEIPF